MRLTSAWMLVLVGSLMLPLVSVTALSSKTYSHVPATTTTPATIAEHASVAGSDGSSSVELQDMAGNQVPNAFSFSRSSFAPGSGVQIGDDLSSASCIVTGRIL